VSIFSAGEPRGVEKEQQDSTVSKIVENIHEMTRALTKQTILWAILKVRARPVAQNFAQIQRPKLSRTLTAAIPRRAPGGFSVSFAPEPDELKPETPASTKRLAKKAKSKERPASKAKSRKKAAKEAELAQRVKPQQQQENNPGRRSEGTPDQASAIARLDNPPTSAQNQEKHTRAEQAENIAGDSYIANSRYDTSVGSGLGDELLIEDSLIVESLELEDSLRAALRSSEVHTKTKLGDSQPAGDNKKREELREKRATEFVVGSGFVLDENPDKAGPAIELVQTLSQILSKKAKKQKQGSRDPSPSSTEPTSPSPVPILTSKYSKVDTESKTGVQTKPVQPEPTKKEPWQVQKQALKKKFGSEGWNPRKKLSPDTIDGIRALHEQYPEKYPTPVLAEKFKVSPEAVRRILKSKWRPDPEKQAERRDRWARRHDRIWDQQAAIGLRPARTKVKEPKEPGDIDENADIEEFHLPRARKQARDMHLAGEN
jgi:hypothetical protein